MASRGFHAVSAALLAGTAIAVWLAVGREPAPASGPASATLAPASAGSGGLGVVAADHDPAGGGGDSSARALSRESDSLARLHNGGPPRPPREPDVPVPAAPPVAAAPGQDEASEAVRSRVAAALRDVLAGRRDALRAACWPPGQGAGASFTVEASFAGDGGLLALGVPDAPGMPGVGTCLLGQLGQEPPVLPAPPGVAVSVAVGLDFPGPALAAPPPTR